MLGFQQFFSPQIRLERICFDPKGIRQDSPM
jgi:hypothetical protein